MKELNIRVTLTEEMLGTKAADPEVFKTYIASKHPSLLAAPDEVEASDAAERERIAAGKLEDQHTTVFHRTGGVIGIWDYQIKGFLKDACGALNRMDKGDPLKGGKGSELTKLVAYQTKIDSCVFVFPRFIPIQFPRALQNGGGEPVGICERPLRASTAQGPRVSLARSETVPPESTLEFTIRIHIAEIVPWMTYCLDYGVVRGLGQWRNSGKGRFTWEKTGK